MRISSHLIIRIADFNNVADIILGPIITRTGRLNYIHLHILRIRLTFHIQLSEFVGFDDILLTFFGITLIVRVCVFIKNLLMSVILIIKLNFT